MSDTKGFPLDTTSIIKRHTQGVPDDDQFDFRQYAALARADLLVLAGRLEAAETTIRNIAAENPGSSWRLIKMAKEYIQSIQVNQEGDL